MNKLSHLSAILSGLALSTAAGIYADSLVAPTITSISVSNNQALIRWVDGRPAYQLQKRRSPSDPWVNEGAPTSNNAVALPISGTHAFFRVVSDFTARYQVVFNATWSQSTHPTDWPSNPHFSGLVGGTHNESVHFFHEDETASEGIRLMAERGQQAPLLSEIAPAITNGTAHFQLSGGGINPSPGNVSLTFPQSMRRDFPLVTLVSMVAPSPDWFVGVDSLSLIEDGQWVTNKIVTLFGMDAGTDSGVTYASPDQVTVPRGVVTRFIGFPALVNGVIVPIGTFAFRRLD